MDFAVTYSTWKCRAGGPRYFLASFDYVSYDLVQLPNFFKVLGILYPHYKYLSLGKVIDFSLWISFSSIYLSRFS